MSDENEWQPVRIAPISKWHPSRLKKARKDALRQAEQHCGDIILVRDAGDKLACGCRRLLVRDEDAKPYFEERGNVFEPAHLSECQILAD